MVFQDVIGGTKIYTNEERIDILVDSFMVGIESLRDMLDITDEDEEMLKDWYRDISPKVISKYREHLSENELDTFLQFTNTPLAKKVLPIQVEVQQEIAPKLNIFLASLEEMKIKERKEKRMIRNMNQEYKHPEDDEWDAR